MQKRALRTSEGIEASDLIGRELRGIGEQLFEADGLGVAAVVEELVEELERRQQVILLDQEVHHAIAQRRSLHVHFSTTSLSCWDETRRDAVPLMKTLVYVQNSTANGGEGIGNCVKVIYTVQGSDFGK